MQKDHSQDKFQPRKAFKFIIKTVYIALIFIGVFCLFTTFSSFNERLMTLEDNIDYLRKVFYCQQSQVLDEKD